MNTPLPLTRTSTVTADAGARVVMRRPFRLRAVALVLDVGTGAAAALGQAPWELWLLTIAGIALLMWRVVHARDARTAFWRTMAIGAGHFALALSWIVEPFLVQPEIYGWMAPFALILTSLGGALFWALPALAAWRAGRSLAGRALLVPLALWWSDWLRGWIFTGFPWALAGHVWIDTPVAQLSAWGGAMALSALTLSASALPVLLRRRPALATLAPVALVVLAWTAGAARLERPLPPDTDLTVRLVQPAADQTRKWDPVWAEVFWERLIELSAGGPGSTRTDLVVWPETAVPLLWNDAGPSLPAIAAAGHAPALIGIQRAEGERWFNSLATVTAQGEPGAVYDKFHLVPFGEYMPFGDALAHVGITAFAAQHGSGYTAGPGPIRMSVPGLPPFQPLICYEAIFESALQRQGERPAWLLQVTNDAWFGTWSGPYQHLAQARLRAIQTGLPLLRDANTGITAAIDAHGGVRSSLPLDSAGALDAPLPGTLPPTLWWRWGDVPMLVLMALLTAAVALRSRRRA